MVPQKTPVNYKTVSTNWYLRRLMKSTKWYLEEDPELYQMVLQKAHNSTKYNLRRIMYSKKKGTSDGS